jgi:hypothetical protein
MPCAPPVRDGLRLGDSPPPLPSSLTSMPKARTSYPPMRRNFSSAPDVSAGSTRKSHNAFARGLQLIVQLGFLAINFSIDLASVSTQEKGRPSIDGPASGVVDGSDRPRLSLVRRRAQRIQILSRTRLSKARWPRCSTRSMRLTFWASRSRLDTGGLIRPTLGAAAIGKTSNNDRVSNNSYRKTA